MNVKEKIGRRVKELREQRAITQKDLSFEAEMDRSYIAGIERGNRNATITILEKIAKAFDLTLAEFFDHPLFAEKEDTKKD
ncbi:helix-turn-helix domain-containing protein [Parabacteroides sp. FAFU027]|uniref:helix-turn-helix domain-containing protein n=1 Tax=Parabacteroides sp. FAFU027 TaxID=2922715 RepID=UPI001FAE84B4|nr:helix-turn-helix transcriptional regulator [Parabacteroides sp. FAFU027]